MMMVMKTKTKNKSSKASSLTKFVQMWGCRPLCEEGEDEDFISCVQTHLQVVFGKSSDIITLNDFGHHAVKT